MFLDASAIIAIIARETGGAALLARLGQAKTVFTSPIAAYESALGLARIGNTSIANAQAVLDRFFGEIEVEIVPITAEHSRLALVAFERFGKGRCRAEPWRLLCLCLRATAQRDAAVQGRRLSADRHCRGVKIVIP